MKHSSPRRAILVLLTALGGTALAAQQTPIFKSATQIVPVFVTATDAQKRLVPDLVQDDFEILDNGVPQQISFFENEPQPITVTVMLDTSASMTLSIDLLKLAAEQFLLRLLPADRGRVGAFNDKIEFTSEFTSNRDDLVGSLKELDFGNPTLLYDAIDVCLDVLTTIEGRRVVLVFTDGDDTGSRASMGDVLNRARQDEVMIYSIGLESNYSIQGRQIRTRPDRGLRRLADETGGGYFELKKTDELNSTFTRVAQELHSQYVLGFAPASFDGKVHKLEVRIKKPGINARARRSYVAVAESTSPSSR